MRSPQQTPRTRMLALGAAGIGAFGLGAIGKGGMQMGEFARSVQTGVGQPVDDEPHPVRVELIPESQGIAPGQSLAIGVRFEIADGWHTYWPGQNDTGFGTSIDAGLASGTPDGFVLSRPAWPAPHRHVSPGDILDHVHEHAVMPIVTLTAPPDARAGTSVTIAFDLAWLVCETVCLPGSESATLTIPVVDRALAPAERTSAHFERSRARIPRSTGSGAAASWSGDRVRITRPGAAGLAFYPHASSATLASLIATGQDEGDTLILSPEPGQAGSLIGVLEVFFEDGRSEVYEFQASPDADTPGRAHSGG